MFYVKLFSNICLHFFLFYAILRTRIINIYKNITNRIGGTNWLYCLNARQAAILDYIKAEIRSKGYPPSVREICEAVQLSSPSTVHAHLATLEKKGYIRRDPQKPRALEVLEDNENPFYHQHEMVDVPILGKINAGLPALAEENFEDTFPVPLDYVRSNKQLYMLRVNGEA